MLSTSGPRSRLVSCPPRADHGILGAHALPYRHEALIVQHIWNLDNFRRTAVWSTVQGVPDQITRTSMIRRRNRRSFTRTGSLGYHVEVRVLVWVRGMPLRGRRDGIRGESWLVWTLLVR